MNVPAICAEGDIMALPTTISSELGDFLSWYIAKHNATIDSLDNVTAALSDTNLDVKWKDYYLESGGADNPHFLGGSTFHTGSSAADTFLFTDEAFTVDADHGANVVHGGVGDNFVKTGIGADTIILTGGNNFIISEAGANTISVTTGHNFISTGLGADSITATSGDNIIDAGDGANTITVSSGDNIITTGSGADNITTAGFDGTVNTIDAGDGANTITTGAGKDTITGGDNADTITSGAGADTIHAGNGANTITTGAGADTVYTGLDVDTVSAGVGDDKIYIYGGTDTISAGSGNDTLIVEYGLAVAAVSVNSLSGDLENGYSGNVSGLGAATFLGVENFDITSGDFYDVITTGGGDDVITTGGGDDIISAGRGDDEMTGGAGADIFVFEDNFGNDVITDFNANSDSDQIDLSSVAFVLSLMTDGDVYNAWKSTYVTEVTVDNSQHAVIFDGTNTNTNTITLTGVDASDLDFADFIF
jgi:Ca2+-binding RTX toxin-like protein